MVKHIKEFIEENTPEMKPSLYTDLLNCAIEYIDFYEIAENILVD